MPTSKRTLIAQLRKQPEPCPPQSKNPRERIGYRGALHSLAAPLSHAACPNSTKCSEKSRRRVAQSERRLYKIVCLNHRFDYLVCSRFDTVGLDHHARDG